MRNRYGFVYIWYDRRHRRFYIGCHWGTEDDGYICSSRWMRQSYRRRPEDFNRRILARVYSNRIDLLEEEYKWLSMIKDEELHVKYYNISKKHFGHWSSDKSKRLSIIEKYTLNHPSKKNPNWGKWFNGWTEESRKKASQAKLGKSSPRKGAILSEETKRKISKSQKARLSKKVI